MGLATNQRARHQSRRQGQISKSTWAGGHRNASSIMDQKTICTRRHDRLQAFSLAVVRWSASEAASCCWQRRERYNQSTVLACLCQISGAWCRAWCEGEGNPVEIHIGCTREDSTSTSVASKDEKEFCKRLPRYRCWLSRKYGWCWTWVYGGGAGRSRWVFISWKVVNDLWIQCSFLPIHSISGASFWMDHDWNCR